MSSPREWTSFFDRNFKGLLARISKRLLRLLRNLLILKGKKHKMGTDFLPPVGGRLAAIHVSELALSQENRQMRDINLAACQPPLSFNNRNASCNFGNNRPDDRTLCI